MIKCININSLDRSATTDELLEQVANLGFEGLELTIDQNYHDITAAAKDRNLQICSLTTSRFDIFSLGSGDEQTRSGAIEHFKLLLSRAAESGRGVMAIIPAHATQPLHTPLADSYEQTFNLAFEALQQLAGDAERLAVFLALENPAAGLFLSPLELRDLIDEINSPYFGLCFNPDNAAHLTNPNDWPTIMNNRILAIRLPNQITTEKKHEKLLTTLTQRHFTGPVVCVNQ